MNGNPRGSLDLGAVEVQTPTGGSLMLRDATEAEMYTGLRDRYIKEFNLKTQNDLMQLSVLLQQAVILERAQQILNGMEPEYGEDGEPNGRWVEVEMSEADIDKAHKRVIRASEQISTIEQQLGIDKKSREKDASSVAEYLKTVKKAAHQYGIHITKRTKMYEEMAMELRWRVRLLRTGDQEDCSHHGVSQSSIVDLLEKELHRIEEHDQQYANEKGKLYLGKI